MSVKTKVLFGKEAREKLMKGVSLMSEVVSETLGPRGRNVAIAQGDKIGNIYARVVQHDGVTTARSIDIADEFENMGAQLLKQAAQKQVQDCGDGTTLAVLLGKAILEQVNILISNGVNPMELRTSLEKYTEAITKIIEKSAIKVTEFNQKKYIATVSAEDEELGSLVAQVVDEMGIDGLIAVEESKAAQTTVERQEGMQLDKGYYNQFFITNPDRNEAILEKPYILATDKDIGSLLPIKDLLETFAKEGKKLVIITPSINIDALGALLQNKTRGVLSSLVIQAPSFGDDQKSKILDVSIFTGGKFISNDTGSKLEDIKIEDLGKADYVTATKTESLIVGGKGKKEAVEKHIEGIKLAIEKETQEFDREKLKERLAKLTSGISVIRVGGLTEVEMLERIEKVKDAVAATRAALVLGIVPGGEVIFLQAREKMPKPKSEIDKLVYGLLYKALYEPFKKLVNNAGLNDGEMYQKLVEWNRPIGSVSEVYQNMGVDIRDNKVKDMIESGIIDPALVSINALKNAVSVAIQIFQTGAIIVPDLEAEYALSKLQTK